MIRRRLRRTVERCSHSLFAAALIQEGGLQTTYSVIDIDVLLPDISELQGDSLELSVSSRSLS
jgi:hypothetical protein